MSRDLIAAAKTLKDAGVAEIQLIAKHDPDMIQQVAAVAFAYAPRQKSERKHNEDCELRGDGPCYCDQN